MSARLSLVIVQQSTGGEMKIGPSKNFMQKFAKLHGKEEVGESGKKENEAGESRLMKAMKKKKRK